MYEYVCICMYMYVYVCICMYMYVYVCICMYMYVYVCICLRVENRTSVLHVFIIGLGWGGVGWADNVHLHFVTYMMLRYCASHI